MRPSISVLITYYNERQLLTECLQSIAQQTDPPDEILVYDDCSTYPASDYVPKDLPATVLRAEENRGPSHGRNALLKASKSDCVHFHDSDDLFEATWCERVRAVLVNPAVDWAMTDVSSYRDGSLVSDNVLGLKRGAGDDLLRMCIGGVALVPSGTYRRANVMAIGGYRTDLWQSEDYDFHIRLALSGARCEIIADPLVSIRLRAESRSRDELECRRCMVRAVHDVAGKVPEAYRRDLTERAADVGCSLLRDGARADALEAFRIANSIGKPSFRNQRKMFRWLARFGGPEFAERVASMYRMSLPEQWRRKAVKAGL